MLPPLAGGITVSIAREDPVLSNSSNAFLMEALVGERTTPDPRTSKTLPVKRASDISQEHFLNDRVILKTSLHFLQKSIFTLTSFSAGQRAWLFLSLLITWR